MKLKIAAALVVLAGGAALAQGDAVNQRKDLMKAVGQATAPIGPMLRGERPFELAAVQNALTVYARSAKAAPALWPAGSEGGDHRTLPAVFAEKDKFNALFTSWDQLATAAQTSIKDEASFKTEMPKVLGACGACHQPYRKPQ
ncbi:MAG: c-type cytochrome [Beijerinckiaceae bacterium]